MHTSNSLLIDVNPVKVRLLVKLALSVLLLSGLLYYVPMADVAAVLEHAHIGFVIAGVILQFLVRGVATFRMKVIADVQRMVLTRWALFRILLITQFYSLILPGTLAAGGAAWMKYVQHGAAKDAAVAAIILNRAIAMTFMVAIGAAAWVWDRAPDGWGGLTATAILAVLIIVVALPVPNEKPAGVQRRLADARWKRALQGVLVQLGSIRNVPTRGKLVVISSSLTHEFLSAVVLLAFAASLGLELSLAQVLWVRAGLQLLLMLPVSVAGLGVREVGLVSFGALLGFGAAESFAWSLLILLGLLVLSIVGAIMEVRHQPLTLRAGSSKGGAS